MSKSTINGPSIATLVYQRVTEQELNQQNRPSVTTCHHPVISPESSNLWSPNWRSLGVTPNHWFYLYKKKSIKINPIDVPFISPKLFFWYPHLHPKRPAPPLGETAARSRACTESKSVGIFGVPYLLTVTCTSKVYRYLYIYIWVYMYIQTYWCTYMCICWYTKSICVYIYIYTPFYFWICLVLLTDMGLTQKSQYRSAVQSLRLRTELL